MLVLVYLVKVLLNELKELRKTMAYLSGKGNGKKENKCHDHDPKNGP